MEEAGVLGKDFAIPFISYDIETIGCEEEYDGRFIKIQKPISIAYFDGKNGDVFTGEDLMKKFLNRMNEIQVRYLNFISKNSKLNPRKIL